jgi:hypothetical protein
VDGLGPDRQGPGPDGAGPDGPAPEVRPEGGPVDAGPPDARANGPEVAADRTVDTPPPPRDAQPTPAANRAFVTSLRYASNLGGLVGADARCQQRAEAAGLVGKFQALLSTSTVPAFSRLGSSRGWVRMDGTPFADTQADLIAGKLYYPLSVDEQGQETTGDYYAFTGTKAGGAPDTGRTGDDWGPPSAACQAGLGMTIDGTASWYAATGQPCRFDAHLFCLEVGRTSAVSPPTPPAGARRAFRSRTLWDPSTGLPSADAICASEAQAASLPGSFLAFLATSTASATSRFDLTGPPWVRTDGVSLVAKASDLASGRVMAALAVGADGQVPSGVYDAWTGADAPDRPATTDNCRNWSSKDPTLDAVTGAPGFSGIDWFSNGKRRCNIALFTGIYCFQR